MTNKECIEHLLRLKMGIHIINALCPDANKDHIDIEALDYAIKVLKGKEE